MYRRTGYRPLSAYFSSVSIYFNLTSVHFGQENSCAIANHPSFLADIVQFLTNICLIPTFRINSAPLRATIYLGHSAHTGISCIEGLQALRSRNALWPMPG